MLQDVNESVQIRCSESEQMPRVPRRAYLVEARSRLGMRSEILSISRLESRSVHDDIGGALRELTRLVESCGWREVELRTINEEIGGG